IVPSVYAQESAPRQTSACASLEKETFSDVEEAPSTIVSVRVVAAKDTRSEFCSVAGYVWPQVGFLMILSSSNWNGKLFQLGCGGACGAVPEDEEADWRPLKKDYACITTDSGHRGRDTLWAYNNPQAQIDFGARAQHVTSKIGKVIAERFYSVALKFAYF